MTLINAILSAQSKTDKKYASPPPEISEVPIRRKKNKRPTPKVTPKVDCTPPTYLANQMTRNLAKWHLDARNLYKENLKMVMIIKKALDNGKVDSRWVKLPPTCRKYYDHRLNTYKRICKENKDLFKLIVNTPPRLEEASSLDKKWFVTKQKIIHMSQGPFVLFPPKITEIIEESAFVSPPDVKRPRVYITLGIRNAATMGTLVIELFRDVCPQTCQLFLDLLDGDGVGFGYVGTRFFSFLVNRKVPNLFWSGGDVAHNNGFGCYAQRGRRVPIGAENYHFPHSMPGLLSMRVTRNDEMCGIFNIIFKPISRFDLKNVVFGRVIRPSKIYDIIKTLGNPISTQPIVEIISTKRFDGKWIYGAKNTRLASERNQIF